MKTVLSSLVVAACLLVLAPTDASAWTCRAIGAGVSTYARNWNVIDAKLIALRRCERRSIVPVCTILWCSPY
jgi:hypothetical protein